MVDHPLRPSATVGVVGAGQLARMLAQAAGPLGIELRVLGGPNDEGAAAVAHVQRGDIGDPDTLVAFAASCDVLTFDHELVPLPAVRAVEAGGHVVRPGSMALAMADKAEFRRVFGGSLRFPVNAVASSPADAVAFGERRGWPIVIKASRGGYDGRGVNVATDADGARRVMEALDAPAVVEPLLEIDAEIAVVVVRAPDGSASTYPVVRTVQIDGICHEVSFPSGLDPAIESEAALVAVEIAAAVDAVGILAVEFFVVGGEVLVNEIAPRTHNSGHWTIDGAATSQFENHLRAVLGWPLGATSASTTAATMLNLIPGDQAVDPRDRVVEALAAGDIRIHLYDKTPRPGRKVGHLTAIGDNPEDVRSDVIAAAAAMGSITAGGVQ